MAFRTVVLLPHLAILVLLTDKFTGKKKKNKNKTLYWNINTTGEIIMF